MVEAQRDRHCGQPIWVRASTAAKPALTRASIVAAAIRIADAEGLDAVSMRRVAAELGGRPMSLYTHIPSKEDLLDLMSDEVSAEVLIEGELPSNWREAITEISRKTMHAMLRHPWVVDLKGRRLQLGPNGLRHVDQSVQAISGLGLADQDVYAVLRTVDEYVLGYGVHEVLTSNSVLEESLQRYFDEIAASGDYPYLAPLLKGGIPKGHTFERGLKWMLDGIEREFGAESSGQAGAGTAPRR